MKKVLLASTAMLAVASTAALADGGTTMTGCGCWYAGASVGGNWLGKTGLETAFSSVLEPSFSTGWALSAQVGYRWENGFRIEGEYAYRRNSVDSIKYGPGTVSSPDGDVTQNSLMANVLYDFRLTDDFKLSIGGGVGIANAKVDLHGFGVPLIVDTNDGWGFAWQLIGGVSYSLSPDTEFYAEYHYMRNDSHDVTTFPVGFPKDDGIDLENSSAMLGVRFAFGH